MSTSRGPGQAWWETHLNAIAREGIGAKAYARREGLPVSSLYYWRRRLKAPQQGPHQPVQSPSPSAPQRQRLFVPVNTNADSVPASRYVLLLGAGLRLELPGLPSPQWLAQVSQALDVQAS
jgi:hypothetical protein